MLSFLTRKPKTAPQPRTHGSGLGLQPGSDHYRAYVGPPEDYDLIAAMTFNLLTSIGLRQHHRLLDVGCGSLRLGRLFIPYLNAGHYVGVEPNEWLVRDGILNEIGADQIQLKRPTFSFADSLREFPEPLALDYAVAQSVFSHCSQALIHAWLKEIAYHLRSSGVLVATYLVADSDFSGEGWIYPGCVKYRTDTMARLGAEHGLTVIPLDWRHPRQLWAAFAKPGFDLALLGHGRVRWNNLVA
jgi:SAM-dependent methyltransferase